jgi:hypothetical protein
MGPVLALPAAAPPCRLLVAAKPNFFAVGTGIIAPS